MARMIEESIHKRLAQAHFVWGKSDCCLAVCNVLRDIHGLDPAAMFRGRYDCKIGAMRFISEHGGMCGLAEAVCGEFGWREISIRDAMPGDVGASNSERCLLIFDGVNWVGKSLKGALFGAEPEKAWMSRVQQ